MPTETIDLKVGSKLHERIRKAVEARYNLSAEHMRDHHENWREAEKQYTAYVMKSNEDSVRDSERDRGVPQYTTIVIPYSYAMLMAAHTYWTSVFLSRNPVFQFQPRHGNVPGNSQAVEAFIDYQVSVGGMTPALFMWLLDVGKYGIGAVCVDWEEEKVRTSKIEMVRDLSGRSKKMKITEEVTAYVGNKLHNVAPYHFFPDPRVSFINMQEGEFCGVFYRVGWNKVVEMEAEGYFTNVEELRDRRHGTGHGGINRVSYTDIGAPDAPKLADEHYAMAAEVDVLDIGHQDFIEMTIELIPKDWGLGSEELPEKWTFTVTEDMEIVVSAAPMGAYHNKFPVFLLLYEPEAYTLAARGLLDTVSGLQDTLDWLFNSHIFNVRRALNDLFIVDPSKVSMSDVMDPLPGGIWRLKPIAYGTDPRLAAHQFVVNDVTRQHLTDAEVVTQMMQRTVGVNDPLMGLVEAGGRRSATEVRTNTGLSVNRLRTNSELFSATGWTLLAQVMLQNSQQYYEIEQQLKIAGDMLEVGGEAWVQVGPESIQGFFDYVPVDGTLPVDRMAEANLWRQLLVDIAQNPQIAAGYDIAKIFGWVAKLGGLKNVSQFKLQVMPPGAQVPAGAVPLNGGEQSGDVAGAQGLTGTSELGGLGLGGGLG